MPVPRLKAVVQNPCSRSLYAAAGLHGFGLMLLAAVTLAQLPGGRDQGFSVGVEMAASRDEDSPHSEPVLHFESSNTESLVTPRMATIDARQFSQMSTADLFEQLDRSATESSISIARAPAVAQPMRGDGFDSADSVISTSNVDKQLLTAGISSRAEVSQRNGASGERVSASGSPLWGDEETPADFSGNSPAIYPVEARRNGLQGTVFLRLNVSEHGEVLAVEIVRSSGHPILDGAAYNMVRRWRGTPRTRGGQPIASVETIPIHFRLQ